MHAESQMIVSDGAKKQIEACGMVVLRCSAQPLRLARYGRVVLTGTYQRSAVLKTLNMYLYFESEASDRGHFMLTY